MVRQLVNQIRNLHPPRRVPLGQKNPNRMGKFQIPRTWTSCYCMKPMCAFKWQDHRSKLTFPFYVQLLLALRSVARSLRLFHWKRWSRCSWMPRHILSSLSASHLGVCWSMPSGIGIGHIVWSHDHTSYVVSMLFFGFSYIPLYISFGLSKNWD